MATPDMGTLGAAPGNPGAASAPGEPQPPKPQQPDAATTPQSPEGAIALAKSQVQIALSLLNSSLSKFQPGSREHTSVMEVTRKLSKQFAGSPATPELAKSETDMLQQQAGQTGSAPLGM